MAQNDIYLVRETPDGTFEEIANSPFRYDAANATDAPDKANNTFHINTKLRVDELEVNGETTIIHTDANTTEQLLVTNDGTGPAVVINQIGAESLIDIQDDGTSAFYIEDGGNVGIGNTNPNEKLRVTAGSNLRIMGFEAPLNGSTNQLIARLMGETNGSNFTESKISFDMASTDGTLYVPALTLLSGGKVGVGTVGTDQWGTLQVDNITGDGTPNIDAWNQSINSETAHAMIRVGVKPGGGNAYYRALVDGEQEWSFGLDSSDENKFKINSSGELGNVLDRLTITETGNVGIGTVSPDCKLRVEERDGNSIIGKLMDIGTSTDVSGLRLGKSHDDGSSAVYMDFGLDSTQNKVGIGIGLGNNSLPLGKTDLSNAEIIIDSAGNVGIGTADPGGTLDLESSSASGTSLFINNTYDSNHNCDWRIQSDIDGKLNLGFFSSSFYKRLTIDATGKVGIGTDTPIIDLDVYGKGKDIGVTSTHADGTRLMHAILGTDTDGNGMFGLYNSVGNKQVNISSKPSENSYINNGGNVGIGTDAANERLRITAGSNSRIMGFEAPYDSFGGQLVARLMGETNGSNFTASKISFDMVSTDGTLYVPALTLLSGGKVGVGTVGTDQWGTLQVDNITGDGTPNIDAWNQSTNSEDAHAMIRAAVKPGGGDAYYRALVDGEQEWSFGLDSSDGNSFKINSSGELGSAGHDRFKIDLNGDIHFAGDLYQNGALFTGGGGSSVSTVIRGLTPADGFNASDTAMFALESEETQPGSTERSRLNFGVLPYGGTNGTQEGNGYIQARTADLLLQPDSGSVGIGTVPGGSGSPKLDVDGSIKADDYGFRGDDIGYYYFDEFGGSNYIGQGSNPYISLFHLAKQTMVWRGGNVGIGTVSPDCKLRVEERDGNSIIGKFMDIGTSTDVSGVRLGKSHDDGSSAVYMDFGLDSTQNKVGIGIGLGNNSLPLGKTDLSNAEIIIDSAGNVGIGTATPESALHVNGQITSEDGALARRSFAVDPSSAASSAILNVVDSTDPNDHKNRLVVMGDGNVGIGTVAPTEKLDIDGAIGFKHQNAPQAAGSGGRLWWNQSLASTGRFVYRGTDGVDYNLDGGAISYNYSGTVFQDGGAGEIFYNLGKVGIGPVDYSISSADVSSKTMDIAGSSCSSMVNSSDSILGIRSSDTGSAGNQHRLNIGILNNGNPALQSRYSVGVLNTNLLLQPEVGGVGIGTYQPGYLTGYNQGTNTSTCLLQIGDDSKDSQHGALVVVAKGGGARIDIIDKGHATNLGWTQLRQENGITKLQSVAAGGTVQAKFFTFDNETGSLTFGNTSAMPNADGPFIDARGKTNEDWGSTMSLIGTSTAGKNVGAGLTLGGSYSGTDGELNHAYFGSIEGVKAEAVSPTGDQNYKGDLLLRTRSGTDMGASDPQGILTEDFPERMRITSEGNVGIGTASPESTLHVNGQIISEDGALARRSFAVDPSSAASSAILNVVDSTDPNDHKNRLVVMGDGNVGIGTVAPRAKLSIPKGSLDNEVGVSYNQNDTEMGMITRLGDKYSFAHKIRFDFTDQDPTDQIYYFHLVFRNLAGFKYKAEIAASRISNINNTIRNINMGCASDESYIYWEDDMDFTGRSEGVIQSFGDMEIVSTEAYVTDESGPMWGMNSFPAAGLSSGGAGGANFIVRYGVSFNKALQGGDINIPDNWEEGALSINVEMLHVAQGFYDPNGNFKFGSDAMSIANPHFTQVSADPPFTPADEAELQTAVDAWIADESAALATYGDINTWDTSGITNMTNIFNGATSFNADISSWNTSNVTSINGMFTNASAFNQDISGWNVSSVTNMYGMFQNATAFNADVSSWDTSNATNMTSMFQNAEAFNQDVSSWDTTSVVSMSNMFSNASAFNQDITSWPLYSSTGYTFVPPVFTPADRTELKTAVDAWIADESAALATYGDISGWVTSSVTNMSNLFHSAASFNADISSWNTSNVINMSGMFTHASAFNQDVSGWNVSIVTSMNSMFQNATSFNQDVSGWNVSSVTSMNSMFQIATSFNQDVSGWNVSSVTSMNNMFYDATSFNQDITSWPLYSSTGYTFVPPVFTPADRTELKTAVDAWITDESAALATYGDISGWVTSSVTDMQEMFNGATSFNADISGWNTSNVTSINGMFTNASAFNRDISGWNVSSVTNMYGMFQNATSFNQDVSGWNVSSVTNMTSMFQNATSFNQDVSGWNVSSVTNMTNMFQNATSFNQDITSWPLYSSTGYTFVPPVFTPADKAELQTAVDAWIADESAALATYGDISGWDTSGITNMNNIFNGAAFFNADISSWNTSNVTSMSGMFTNAPAFNQDVSGWNVSSVTSMTAMFQNATSFNADISGWDVSSVTNMFRMFNGAYVFNQPIGLWGQKTINVTDTSHMFASARAFNQPIGDWNMQSVQKINNMFQGEHYDRQPFNGSIASWNLSNCIEMSTVFEYCDFNQPLNTWNTSQVTTMSQMFANAQNFDQDISSWNTSNVTSFFNMFRATPFNQNISSWNTSSATNMSYMFMDTAHFNQPIGVWNTSSLLTADGMFSNAASFNQDLSNWDISALTGSTANSFLSNVTLSSNNYDSLLNGWSTLSAGEAQIPTNVNFHAGYSQYSSAGEAARYLLVNTYNWIIADGGQKYDWIRAGSVHSPANSAYGSNAMEDWHLASYNDEDLWRFQQHLPGQDITYNGTVYSGGGTANTLNVNLVTAVGSYNNASLGGSGIGGANSRILTKQTENGNYPVLTGWPSKDYLVEIQVGKNIRWGASDPGIGGKLDESETAAFTLDDSAFADSVGDGWYFIDSHNNAASGTNKVFKIDSQGQIIRVINCVDIFSNTDLVEPSFAAQFTIS
jgi:surface protein